MAMAVVAFGLFQIWHYAFLMGIFTHSLWIGWSFVMVVSHAFLWTADHAHDTPEMLFPIQVWWTFQYLVGWIASAMFVHYFGTPKLVDASSMHARASGRPMMTLRGVGSLAFFLGWLALFGAINFFMKRFSTTGMSPYDPLFSDADSNLAGWLTGLTGLGLVGCSTWRMAVSEDEFARITIKYLWVLCSVIWTLFVHDYMTDVMFAGAVDWLPGGIQFIVFTIVMIVVGPLMSIFINVTAKTDPFYLHRRRTWRFFGAAFLAVAGAHLPSWFINVLTNGNEVYIFFALAVYTALLGVVIYFVAASMQKQTKEGYTLLNTRSFKGV